MTKNKTPLTPTSSEGVAALSRARSAYLLVGLAVPIVVTGLFVVLMLLWLPEVPDPAATHWGLSGADDSGPGWTFVVMATCIGIGLPAIFAGATFASAARAWGWTQRFLGAAAAALSVFMSGGMAWSVHVQRGLTDWRQAPDIGGALLIAAAIALAVGVIAWFCQPAVTVADDAQTAPAAPMPLPEHARAMWSQRVTVSAPVLALLIATAVASLVVALITAASGHVIGVVVLGVAVVVSLLSAATSVFSVRVDASGLTVRSGLGWPAVHVASADIASVHTREVAPLAEFGGWGLRKIPGGASAIVLRAGSAIEVRRHDGRVFVVTVNDAERGAALLQQYAAAAAASA